MNIEAAEPSKIDKRRRSHKYAELIATLTENPLTWFRIAASDVTGADNEGRRCTIHGVTKYHELKIETKMRGDDLYIRSIPGKKPVTVTEASDGNR